MIKYTIKFFLIVFVFLTYSFQVEKHNKHKYLMEKEYHVFCNIKNPHKERIMLYDSKYFLWIKENTDDSTSNYMDICMGKYYLENDTIFFAEPDSTDLRNRFYCFCKSKYDKHNQLHLRNRIDSLSNNFSDKYPYSIMFKAKSASMGGVECTLEKTKKAIITKNKSLMFTTEQKEFVLFESGDFKEPH